MKIESNASSSELSSPYFTINKEFCSDFEKFVASKNGKVKGNYNAWSYKVFGKIINPKSWDLMYKKSTFSSTGNLLLSSKKQSLFLAAEWKTKRIGTHNHEFVIRKKTRMDFIKLGLIKSLSKFDISNEYIIKLKGKEPEILSKLLEILDSLFQSNEIYRIEHKNEKLSIQLSTDKHHFNIFNKLTEL